MTSRPRELFVNIDAQGRYYVTGELVDADELKSIFDTAWRNNPGRASVIIRADRKAPFHALMAAINACEAAKIGDLRVTVREETPEE